MKVSVIISIKNRTKLFRRSLKLYNKQSMPRSEWELVVVDDNSDEDVLATLKEYASDLNWQYIRMDSHRNDFPIFWGPALSNNVGFRSAAGEVIVITGPEILISESALEQSYNGAMLNKAIFGHVLHSHPKFVRLMDSNPAMEDYSFDRLFVSPLAKVQDLTSKNFYWFWMAVKKETVMAINGCDEQFMHGICGDDDDFANRLHEYGAHKTHDMSVKGIHQDHKSEDVGDPKRVRWDATWEPARLRNTKYLEDWLTVRGRNPVANESREWGSESLVISRERNKGDLS